MALVAFSAPWKHQENSCFLMYFRKYRKRPVPWNELKIFLTNMSANVDIHACSITEHTFLQLLCTGSFKPLKRYKMVWFKFNFKEHLSVTASGRCSWQPPETINCTLFPETCAITCACADTHPSKFKCAISHAWNYNIFTFCFVIIIYFP